MIFIEAKVHQPVFWFHRERYKHFLQRPDLKQELVSKWQKDFNNIPDDMREDEDTKAELHLRLDVRRCRTLYCKTNIIKVITQKHS